MQYGNNNVTWTWNYQNAIRHVNFNIFVRSKK